MRLHLPIILFRFSDAKLLQCRKLQVGQVNSIKMETAQNDGGNQNIKKLFSKVG